MKSGVIVDRIRGKSWRLPSGATVTSDAGWDVTIVTDRPGPQYDHLDGRTNLILLPELSSLTLANTVAELQSERPLSAISTTSELFLDDVASIRDRFNIPGPGTEYTARLRDKWSMKTTALSAGVPCAEGTLGNELREGVNLLKKYGQCVVKPRRLSGSRDIHVLRDSNELARWSADCHDATEYLIEEFVPGPMLHIDGFVAHGRLVWQLSAYERPTHICGNVTPLSSYTVDDPALKSLAFDFIRKLVDAWEITSDVFHCEVFLTPNGLALCEVAGRPGGAGVSEVFASTQGIDLYQTKTLLDFGECAPKPQLRATEEGREGGWSVFYSPGPEHTTVSDGGLTGHHSKEVRDQRGTTMSGFSGVGLVTYTYLGESTADVRATISRYEQSVRIIPDARSGLL